MSRRTRRRAPLVDRTNDNVASETRRLTVRVERCDDLEKRLAKYVPKRAASRKAAAKIVEAVTSVLNLGSDLPESARKHTSKCVDVYEFTYDPKEESAKKSRKGRLQHIIDDSGDENNSMKDVMQNLRKVELHRIKKAARKINKKRFWHKGTAKISNAVMAVTQPERDTADSANVSGNPLHEMHDTLADDSDGNIDECEDNVDRCSEGASETQHRSLQQTIRESFVEEVNQYDDTSSHITAGSAIPDSVLHSLRSSIASPAVPSVSNPWRLSVLPSRNPHTFTVKDKSFVPNYDQDIVINSTFSEKVCSPPAPRRVSNKCTVQPSIVSYMSNAQEYVRDREVAMSGGLFQSPRKVLGELNFQQSTPVCARSSYRVGVPSPNLSAVACTEQDSRPGLGSLFGFSVDEDQENVDPSSVSRRRAKKRGSPKRERPRIVLFAEPPAPCPDVQLLFQDVRDDQENLQVKKCRRSYEHMRPRRKRLPSWHCDDPGQESDEELQPRERPGKKRTKKEELELERLAQHYNSMFEEIEQHALLIE